MKRLLILAALATSACSSVPLGTFDAPRPMPRAQIDMDKLACKDAAQSSVLTPERDISSAFLQATIIGAPLDYAWRASTIRKAWSECMTRRGYTVHLPE